MAKFFLKDWLELKYSGANNLLVCTTNVAFDKGAPVAQLARINASVGRSKTDFAKCNLKIKKKKFHPPPPF